MIALYRKYSPFHVALLIIIVLTACTPTATPTPTARPDFRACVLLNAGGTINDGTFNELAYNGAVRAAQEFGLGEVTYKTTVEDKEYPAVLDNFVTENCKVIVTVGFQTQDATIAAAKKYPNVYFVGVDEAGPDTPANFISVLFKEDQGGFIAGALAGMMTKTNIVGVIGGIEIPAITRFVEGFRNGATYVNPDVTVLHVYTTSFASPDEGQAEAEKMIDQKADVIFGAAGLTGSSGIVRAAELKTYVIGVDQDEYNTTFVSGKDREFVLSSAVKRTDAGVYQAIKSIVENKITNTLLIGAAECGINYAPFHDAENIIPADVKTKLDAIWRGLASGTIQTGAANPGETAPTPLKAGEMPPIADNAPQRQSCGA